MQITCTTNTETGEMICNIPYPTEGGIEYNPVVSPEQTMIFIVVVVWFFSWSLERLFYYTTNRIKKAKYDS